MQRRDLLVHALYETYEHTGTVMAEVTSSGSSFPSQHSQGHNVLMESWITNRQHAHKTNAHQTHAQTQTRDATCSASGGSHRKPSTYEPDRGDVSITSAGPNRESRTRMTFCKGPRTRVTTKCKNAKFYYLIAQSTRRQTDKQTDRQTDRHKSTHVHARKQASCAEDNNMTTVCLRGGGGRTTTAAHHL